MKNEDLPSICRVLSLTLFLILGNQNIAQAKTNYNALHTQHDIIAKRECGTKGYQAISKDNYGGYSYGKWQLSTERRKNRPSTFDFFLKYTQENAPYIHDKLIKAGGQPAAYIGKPEFIETWKKLAERQDFQKIYEEFLLNTQIIPVYDRLDNLKDKRFDKVTTWGSTDNAIQAAIKSAIIQHGSGGAFGIIYNIMTIYNPTTKEQFLKKIYDYRKDRFPRYTNRYIAEYKDLNKYLSSGNSKIVSNINPKHKKA